MKISQVKSDIQVIIANIQQLQACRDNLTKNNFTSEIAQIAKCKENLEQAFSSLESKSIEQVVTHLKNRKIKRCTRRLKMKKKRKENPSHDCHRELPSSSVVLEQQPLTTSKKRELRCANKYLAIMESLETLHRLRGGGDSCKLKETLNPIRSIWQSTAQSIGAEMGTFSSNNTQWDQVLFGRNPEIEVKYGMRDLIERRCIWDSYLVSEEDPNGSHIPIGWVYPREDARPEWKQFRL